MRKPKSQDHSSVPSKINDRNDYSNLTNIPSGYLVHHARIPAIVADMISHLESIRPSYGHNSANDYCDPSKVYGICWHHPCSDNCPGRRAVLIRKRGGLKNGDKRLLTEDEFPKVEIAFFCMLALDESKNDEEKDAGKHQLSIFPPDKFCFPPDGEQIILGGNGNQPNFSFETEKRKITQREAFRQLHFTLYYLVTGGLMPNDKIIDPNDVYALFPSLNELGLDVKT